VIFYCTEFTIVSVDFHMDLIVFVRSGRLERREREKEKQNDSDTDTE